MPPRKLNICHIAMGDLWAGAEVQLASLARELQGHTDLVLSVLLFNEGRLAEELRALEVPVKILPERELSIIGIFRGIVEWLRSRHIDIVHTHKYKDNLLGALAAKACGVPHVVRTVHGLPEPFLGMQRVKIRLYESLDHIIIRAWISRLICVSGEIEQLMRNAYSPGRVVRIYNGIRPDMIRPGKSRNDVRKDLGLSSCGHLLGVVGRLTPVKGHQFLLRALHALHGRGLNAHLLVAGDGPCSAELRQLVAKLGIDEYVHFLGQRNDVYDLINALDLFVLPSLHEGIPMVLLEAMALEMPIVASHVGGIKEVLEQERSGLMVAPGDPESLADACIRILNNRELSVACGAAARARLSDGWLSRDMGNSMRQLYCNIVFSDSSGVA